LEFSGELMEGRLRRCCLDESYFHEFIRGWVFI
jgi:hypothetical protein